MSRNWKYETTQHLPNHPFRQVVAALTPLQAGSPQGGPRFTAGQKLDFPSEYREWVFLSSGRGMTYGPAANPNGPPLFDNLFVQPRAYQSFMKTGKLPDQSVFVLEVRSAATEGSINKGGSFQTDLVTVEVEVKDTKRFADTDGWGYFNFERRREPVAQLPRTEACYACHGHNTAVEHTFVQFYPTLIDIAKAHGTFRQQTSDKEP